MGNVYSAATNKIASAYNAIRNYFTRQPRQDPQPNLQPRPRQVTRDMLTDRELLAELPDFYDPESSFVLRQFNIELGLRERDRWGRETAITYDRFEVVGIRRGMQKMLDRAMQIDEEYEPRQIIVVNAEGEEEVIEVTTMEEIENYNGEEQPIDPEDGMSLYSKFLPYHLPSDMPSAVIDEFVKKIETVRRQNPGRNVISWVIVRYAYGVAYRETGKLARDQGEEGVIPWYVKPSRQAKEGSSNVRRRGAVPSRMVFAAHSNVRAELDAHLRALSDYILEELKREKYPSVGDTFTFYAGVWSLDLYAVPGGRRAARRYFEVERLFSSHYIQRSSCINPKNLNDDYCILWCLYLDKLLRNAESDKNYEYVKSKGSGFPQVPKHKRIIDSYVNKINELCDERGIERIDYSSGDLTDDQLCVIEDFFGVYLAIIKCDYEDSDYTRVYKKRVHHRAVYFGKYVRYMAAVARVNEEGSDTDPLTLVEDRPVAFVWNVAENEWLDGGDIGTHHAVYIRDIGAFLGNDNDGNGATICHKCMGIIRSKRTTRKKAVLEHGKTVERFTRYYIPYSEVLKEHLEVCNGLLVREFNTKRVYKTVSLSGSDEDDGIPVGFPKYFTNYSKMMLHPGVVYYDMETRRELLNESRSDKKIVVDSEHITYQISSVVSCISDESVLTKDDYDYDYYDVEPSTSGSNRFVEGVRVEYENEDGSVTINGPELAVIREVSSSDEKKLINEFILYLIKCRTALINTVNKHHEPILNKSEKREHDRCKACQLCFTEFSDGEYWPKRTKVRQLKELMREYDGLIKDAETEEEEKIYRSKRIEHAEEIAKLEDELEKLESRRKMIDYCRVTGKYRASVCKKCYNALRWNKTIICFAHNGKNFDGIKVMNLFDPDYLLDLPGAVDAILDGYYIRKALFYLKKTAVKKRLGDLYYDLPDRLKWAAELSKEDEERADELYRELYGEDLSCTSLGYDSLDDEIDRYVYECDYDDLAAAIDSDDSNDSNVEEETHIDVGDLKTSDSNVEEEACIDDVDLKNGDGTLFSRLWIRAIKERTLPHSILKFLCYESVIKNKMGGIHECASKWKTMKIMHGIEFHDTLQCMAPGTSLASFAESYDRSVKKAGIDHEEAYSSIYKYVRTIAPEVPDDVIKREVCSGKGIFPYRAVTDYKSLFRSLEDIPASDFEIDEDIYSTLKKEGKYSREELDMMTREAVKAKAVNVYRALGCKNLLEYSRLYCVSDTLLLFHAFSQYRKNLYQLFNMDIAHFIGLPSFSENVYKYMDMKESGMNYYNAINDAIYKLRRERAEKNQTKKKGRGRKKKSEHDFNRSILQKLVDICDNSGALVSCPDDRTRTIFRNAVAGGLAMVFIRKGKNLAELDQISLYPSAMTYDIPLSVKREVIMVNGRPEIVTERQCTVEDAYRMILEDDSMSRYFFCVDMSIPLTVDEAIENVPDDLKHRFDKLKSIVDREFGGKLHDYLSFYPIFMSKKKITSDVLSPYNYSQLPRKPTGEIDTDKYDKQATEKFIGHMLPMEYALGYQSLLRAQILRGARIDKVHFYMEMHTKKYFEPFVSKNHGLRRKYKIEGDDMMQLAVKNVLTSAYGKTVQDPTKYTDIKLVDNYDAFVRLVDNDRFLSANAINNRLAVVELMQSYVDCNDTPHVGAAILNIAKFLMIDKVYDMRDAMPHSIKAYYTDTDSIYCSLPDNYLDVMIDENKWENCLDVASFAPRSALKRDPATDEIIDFNPEEFYYLKDPSKLTLDMLKKTDGALCRFKMESCDITEAVFIKSKCYSYTRSGGKTTVKTKGVTLKSRAYAQFIETVEKKDGDETEIIEKRIDPSIDVFRRCIDEGIRFEATHTAIRSKNSRLYNVVIRKNALNCIDDKSWVEEDGVTTRFYGYNMQCGYEALRPKNSLYPSDI